MRTVVGLGFALLVVALHAAAAAQAGEPAHKKTDARFSHLDVNRDGFLSYQEARVDKEAAQHFAQFDENRDNRLSEDEFLKLKAAQARHRSGVRAGVTDAWITSKVKLAVLRAKDMKTAEIHVETIVGTVRLTGEVESALHSARAEQLAARVKGVKKVDNRLRIRRQ
jgi:osmotically-inducible protein OsmY